MTTPGRLPERIDPRRLAAARGEIEGTVELAALPRLADYLLVDEAPSRGLAHLQLRFVEDAQRRVLMQGRLRADLTLQCQRCLQGIDWPLDAVLQLVAVPDDEAAAQAPRDWDPVVVGDNGLDTAGLVEDELILAMPAVARCDDADCPYRPRQLTAGRETVEHPFAALRQLKRD